jgi:DnaJ-class molecular chaperone
MKQKNFYEILGVPENATESDIKSAYRKLAKKYHPDKNPGDPSAEGKFKEIGEAYETLHDPDKRKKYDELRKYTGPGASGGSMSYEEFIRRFGGQRAASGEAQNESTWGFDGSSLDDIFSSLFGGQRARQRTTRRPQQQQAYEYRFANERDSNTEPQPTDDPFFKRKGADAYADVTINVAQAVLGSTIRVRTPSNQHVHVKIQAGTQPETSLRVAGMGFESGRQKGDLYIRIHLRIPSGLTEDQIEKMRDLAASLNLRY